MSTNIISIICPQAGRAFTLFIRGMFVFIYPNDPLRSTTAAESKQSARLCRLAQPENRFHLAQPRKPPMRLNWGFTPNPDLLFLSWQRKSKQKEVKTAPTSLKKATGQRRKPSKLGVSLTQPLKQGRLLTAFAPCFLAHRPRSFPQPGEILKSKRLLNCLTSGLSIFLRLSAEAEQQQRPGTKKNPLQLTHNWFMFIAHW